MDVRVDPELCTGCGLCVDVCPEVFEMGNEGIAMVLIDEVTEETSDGCAEAVDACPTGAISIE